MNEQPLRQRSEADRQQTVPVHVVWEITLACNLNCGHCGSRAGRRRPDELTTQECLDVVRQLDEAGTREITLIGGEAYLRKDWLLIAEEISRRGMLCGIQTGARGLTRERICAAADAGVRAIGVSIDGTEAIHDELRGFKGSHRQAMQAISDIAECGIRPGVNTQINALSAPHLREIYEQIVEAGARSWQVQLTVAMGNAVDNSHVLLQPYRIIEVVDDLYQIYEDGLKIGFRLIPGNSIGYFGRYEARWRSLTEEAAHWGGCTAGETTLGLEADGTVKGCPSLSRDAYAGGNSREVDIQTAIANLEPRRVRNDGNRGRGFCNGCYYWDFCQGGCTWVTHSLTGERGNNPYCYYRASSLAKRGLREIIRKEAPAPNLPFAIGKFSIVVEDEHGHAIDAEPVDINGPLEGSTSLVVCEGCGEYVGDNEISCVHCGQNMRQVTARLEKTVLDVESLIDEIALHNRRLNDLLSATGTKEGSGN